MHYVIMHGSFGSPEENWFRWLEQHLISVGHTVTLDQYPCDNWDQLTALGPTEANAQPAIQTLGSWEDFFVENTLPNIQTQETVVVAHSLAPLFMLHMVTKYDLNLRGMVAVSPFFTIPDDPATWQFWAVNKTFYKTDFDTDKLKGRLGHVIAVYGDDDPYVPQTELAKFADALANETHIVPQGGHCGRAFKEFPLVGDLAIKIK